MERITDYLVADHGRLRALLGQAMGGSELALDAYEAFRAGLLRHLAIEEKLLFPAAKAARGAPLSQMPVIRAAHAEIAALLAIHPTPERCARLQALLEAHDAVEEGEGGAYADCEQALGPDASVALGGRARAFGAVRVAKYRDLAPP